MDSIKVPQTPTTPASIYLKVVPDHIIALAIWISNGLEGSLAVNGMDLSPDGDLVLYRRITKADKSLYSTLGDVDEIWITLDIPEAH